MFHARVDYSRIQDPAGKIPADEPVFLLRGQDRFAAQAVRDYANAVEADAMRNGTMTYDTRILVRASREQAERMHDWAPKKFPDIMPLAATAPAEGDDAKDDDAKDADATDEAQTDADPAAKNSPTPPEPEGVSATA